LQAYREALTGRDTAFVLSPEGNFFRFFNSSQGAGSATASGSAPGSAPAAQSAPPAPGTPPASGAGRSP